MSITERAQRVLSDVTKRMEESVIERTNLLLDYSEKFINQTNSCSNPIESRPQSSMLERKCSSVKASVGQCRSQINHLDSSKKHEQLLGLTEAMELITSYFAKAIKRCDDVLSKLRCRKLMVSGTSNKRFLRRLLIAETRG